MSKFFVYYNRGNGRYETREANIVGETEDNYAIEIDNKVIYKRKESFYNDRAYTDIVKKEMITSKIVKKNFFKGKRYMKCPTCGKKIDASKATIEHLVPKAFFLEIAKEKYGEDDLRKVPDLWKQCWNFQNLSVVCEDCNKRKGSSKKVLDRYIGIKSYRQKKYECISRNNRKVHIQRNIFGLSKDVEEYVAKRYGNTFSIKDIK